MASHRVGLFEVRQAGFLEEEVDLFNPAIGGSLAPAIDTDFSSHVACCPVGDTGLGFFQRLGHNLSAFARCNRRGGRPERARSCNPAIPSSYLLAVPRGRLEVAVDSERRGELTGTAVSGRRFSEDPRAW